MRSFHVVRGESTHTHTHLCVCLYIYDFMTLGDPEALLLCGSLSQLKKKDILQLIT